MHSFLEEDCLSFKELNHVEKKLYHFLENNIKERTMKLVHVTCSCMHTCVCVCVHACMHTHDKFDLAIVL